MEFLSLKVGCKGLSECTRVKMPHCWKSHATAHFFSFSDCYVDNGESYRGTASVTDKGTTCINWDVSGMHTPTNTPNKVSTLNGTVHEILEPGYNTDLDSTVILWQANFL